MSLSTQRQGEIARKIVKNLMKKRGLVVGENFNREAGDEAKKLGEDPKDYREFLSILSRELFAETFDK